MNSSPTKDYLYSIRISWTTISTEQIVSLFRWIFDNNVEYQLMCTGIAVKDYELAIICKLKFGF